MTCNQKSVCLSLRQNGMGMGGKQVYQNKSSICVPPLFVIEWKHYQAGHGWEQDDMVKLNNQQMREIAHLFDGIEETLIWSCLQGRMGDAWADQIPDPNCAQIIIGDFCFLAGDPLSPGAINLIRHMPRNLLTIPKDQDWGQLLVNHWQGKCRKIKRYALKKEPDVFDKKYLSELVKAIPEGYQIKPVDQDVYQWSHHSWGRDFCSQFPTWEDYQRDGLGFVVWYQGEIAAGASSYTVYDGGIEIEVDTREDHTRKGLASACSARLILECLDKGIYPSWDAANPISLALAQKLGYHPGDPYDTYVIMPQLSDLAGASPCPTVTQP